MLCGTILFSAASIVLVNRSTLESLTLLRVLQGLGASACLAMVRAIVSDAFERSEAARQMSTISIVLSIAPALSIAFGGVLAEYAGWKGIMTLLSVCGVVMLVSACYLATETNVNRLRVINVTVVLSAYFAVLKNRLFLCWALASGMQIGIFFCLNGLLAYQYQRNGYTLAEFGLWFSLTPVFYLIGNSCNRLWFVYKGIERAAMTGCSLSLIAVVALFVTQAAGFTHALSLALPCCLFGFSNGIVVANSTVGAITAAGRHAGTGSGVVGAWQMAAGGIAGAIIVAVGGTEYFSVAAGALIIMSTISVLSMSFVYRHRQKSRV